MDKMCWMFIITYILLLDYSCWCINMKVALQCCRWLRWSYIISIINITWRRIIEKHNIDKSLNVFLQVSVLLWMILLRILIQFVISRLNKLYHCIKNVTEVKYSGLLPSVTLDKGRTCSYCRMVIPEFILPPQSYRRPLKRLPWRQREKGRGLLTPSRTW